MLVTLLLIALAFVVRSQLRRPEDAVLPGERANLALFAQYFVEAIYNLAEGVIGHGAARYVPLLGTFFIFILVSNLLGLIPGFSPPTSNFNITLALGAVAFVAYHVYGFREHGPGYAKQFLGPVVWLAPLMLMVEIFSHAFRPISLAIRLFANLFADHTVLEIFTGFFPHVVLPLPFYALGAFVSVIQAFVFTMLTAIYISLAISHEH
jgi:F-type H+-transporting ATPase subunit a